MKLRKLIIVFGLLAVPIIVSAQVTISSTGTPSTEESAILDIQSSDKGLLIPRMEIDDVDSQVLPVNNPADGLLIYNTGTATVPDKGVYMWSATHAEWIAVITSKSQVVQTMSSGYGGYVMQWGGQLKTDRWALFGGSADDDGEAASNYKTKGSVPRDGVIKTFAWSSDKANATSHVALIIDGATTIDLHLTGEAGVIDLDTPTAITAGQKIEFKGLSGTAPDFTGILLYID